MDELSVLAQPAMRASGRADAAAPAPFDVGEEFCAARPGARIGERQYAFAALGVVLSGWIEYRAQTGSATAVPGTVILANCGEYFSCRHADATGSRRLVVRFSSEFLDEVAEDCGLTDSRMRVAALPPGKNTARMFGWVRRLALQNPRAEDAAYALAVTALGARRAGSPVKQTHPRSEPRMRTVMRYIEAHYAEPCSLKTLAGLADLSRYHFVRGFRAAAGVPPNQYLIATRLRAAADRLLTTRAPVAEIAFGVGFNDISHFNTSFRTTFCCTPTAWRAGSW